MKSTFYFFLSSVLPKIAGFLFAMIYARILSPEEFGKMSVWVGWYSLVSVLISFSFPQSYARNRLDSTNFISSYFVVGIISGLFLAFLLELFILGFDSYIVSILQIDFTSINIAVFAGLLMYILNMYLARYVVEGKPLLHMRLSLVIKIVPFLVFVLLACFLLDNDRLLYARYFAEISLVMVVLYLLKGERIDRDEIMNGMVQVLKYNRPFIIAVYPTLLLGLVVTHVDKLFLSKYSLDVELGSYALTYNFILAFSAIGGAFRMSLEKDFYEELDPDQNIQYGRKVRGLNWVMSIVLIVSVFLLKPFSTFLYGETYKLKSSVFTLLLSATYFDYMYGILIRTFLLKRQFTWVIPLVSTVALVVNLFGNVILVPRLDQTGAALSTLFSSIMLLLSTALFSRYFFGNVSFRLLRGVGLGLVFAICVSIVVVLYI